MDEEEIIEKCQIFIDLYNADSDDWDMQDTKEAIQGLLDLYNKTKQELQQEKEKNKKLEEERLTGIQVRCMQEEAYIKARADFERDYKERSQLYEEVIDMMSEDIFNGFVLGFNSTEHVKEYYFKEARKE